MVQEKQHYIGHRARLRERFLTGDDTSLPDYELLEILLFSAKPRGDVKPLAKSLLTKFGSLKGVLYASENELAKLDDVGEGAIACLKAVRIAAQRMLREEIKERPIIQSWTSLLDYCRSTMGEEKIEQFRILFLNHKNTLITDEVQQTGTVNHTPVYPREVVKRALELGASALILCHNHPSGDPTPSKPDIDMTNQIQTACAAVGIEIHDHLIITQSEHYSFKSHGLL